MLIYGHDGKRCRARKGRCSGCGRAGKLIVLEGPSGSFCRYCARELDNAWKEHRAPRFRAKKLAPPSDHSQQTSLF